MKKASVWKMVTAAVALDAAIEIGAAAAAFYGLLAPTATLADTVIDTGDVSGDGSTMTIDSGAGADGSTATSGSAAADDCGTDGDGQPARC
ncbi:MAG: hypothetical protein HY245_13125 [Rhizobiales bacterium]|nr:hypothetical protein [Hyphomicrobiales bacterium]MBI3674332.1 hypothetical protein [Hyphomicrobiales bacterium]